LPLSGLFISTLERPDVAAVAGGAAELDVGDGVGRLKVAAVAAV
jgi:hypothetical protein